MPVRTKKLTPQQKRKKNIKLVVKANQLVEAKYMFDVWEMRVFLSLVSLISPTDEDGKVYRIWYKDIKENFNIKFKSYKLLREAADRLFDKRLVVGYMKDGYEREKKHHLVSTVDTLKEGQTGKGIKNQEYVDMRIDSAIRPYLLDIRKHFDPSEHRYTSYELRNVIDLQSYGIRLYELLKQFESIGYRIIKIGALKDSFNITNEYPRFSNFYQKVIQKHIKDINEKTDITVPLDKIQKIKKGRKIEALRFLILSKNKQELSVLRDEPKQGSLFDVQEPEIIEPHGEKTEADILFEYFEEVVIQKFGVTPTVFVKMLMSGKYSKHDIEQAIEVTHRAKYKQEIKKSVAGFFIKALQDGFTDEKVEQKKKQQKKKVSEEIEKARFQKMNELDSEISKRMYQRVRELVESKEGVRENVLNHIKSNPPAPLKVKLSTLKISIDDVTVDIFRKYTSIRGFFINTIVELYQSDFEDIQQYNQNELEKINNSFSK